MFSYECQEPPGQFEDDALHPLWFVEWGAVDSGSASQTERMTWAEATQFVDELLTKYDPDRTEYVIHRVE